MYQFCRDGNTDNDDYDPLYVHALKTISDGKSFLKDRTDLINQKCHKPCESGRIQDAENSPFP